MSIPVLQYHESDLIYLDKPTNYVKPTWPQLIYSHHSADQPFNITEDLPLNKRHFIYQLCSANPLLNKLKYSSCEYPFDDPGISFMDRSDSLAIKSDDHCTVSVNKTIGWRSGRCDVCVKEGMAYWEIELVNGGTAIVDNKDESKHIQDKLNSTPHVRFGISRREALLETPVGCDIYGYGIRDNILETIHDGKITHKFQPCTLKNGDRIGLLLKLPDFDNQYEQAKTYNEYRIKLLSSFPGEHSRKRIKSSNQEFQKALLRNHDPKDIIRDQIAIRYKSQLFFESTDYVKTTKPEYYTSEEQSKEESYLLKDSYLKVYLNDTYLGVAFEDLLPFLPPFSELQYNEKFYMAHWKNSSDVNYMNDTNSNGILKNKFVNNNKLGYYPSISCFNGGVAKIITAPNEMKNWETVKGEHPSVKSLNEIYLEQISDEIIWDLIDEIEV